ncbi:CHRD domain-containing protein [Aeromicrobium sp. CF4.19]|uniref:CHRD domain-containing protein n=1 Tax=Aeromicrobium sp. CF4.19 TaxID=3373082 RepID=UPI003EE6E8BF
MKTSTSGRRLAALAMAAPVLVMAAGSPASAETEVERPDSFTSAFTAMATPDTIIDPDGEPVDGEEGATGAFSFMINSDEEIICYDIELEGVTGDYESPAKTATHIHEAAEGEAGPPRLAFPDPEGEGTRTSSGCLQGPFTTGLEDDGGNDTGEGFTLSQIEDDPASFNADTHTADFAAGAVRGQLQSMPVDGVDTGQGALAQPSTSTGTVAALGVAGVVLAGAAGVAMRRRAHA